jgi:hypothetical protein
VRVAIAKAFPDFRSRRDTTTLATPTDVATKKAVAHFGDLSTSVGGEEPSPASLAAMRDGRSQWLIPRR